MAFGPVSFSLLQYEDFVGFWLKAFIQNTVTPISMSLDAAGGSLVAKLELDTEGQPNTTSNVKTVFYLDVAYDLWLFPTEAEADANDTTNAVKYADDVSPASTQQNNDDLEATLIALIAATTQDATTTVKGIVELATSAETITGTDATRAITAQGLAAKVTSTTVEGITRLSTDTEAITSTSVLIANSPASANAAKTQGSNVGTTGNATGNHVQLPDWLGKVLVCWGIEKTDSASQAVITLPRDFANTNYSAFTNHTTPTAGGTQDSATVISDTKTVGTFQIRHNGAVAITDFYWIAVGLGT